MTLTATLSDFPDRLSPMVVKELRQGLRTKLFRGVMLVLHTLMVLITLSAGVSSDGAAAGEMMNSLMGLVFWGIFPLSGFSALAGEIRAGTMDMLVLTRLSAGRIVLGKWAAIVIQSLLVAISMAPYIVARYVYGGTDLFADLAGLGFQWLVSSVLTAGVVALSTQRHFWVRAVIIAVPLLFSSLTSMTWLMFNASFRGSSSSLSQTQTAWNWVCWIIGGAWLIFALLSFAASRIAPASSLLSVTKRLVNFAALPFLAWLQWKSNGGAGLTVVLDLVLIVASVDALTDELRLMPTVYLPFYRRSWWGRLAGVFLAPGWMHGYAYSLLITVAGMGMAVVVEGWEAAATVWLVMCAFWMSAFFGHLLAIRRTGQYLGALFAGAWIMGFFTVLMGMLRVKDRSPEMEWVNCLLPLNAFWTSKNPSAATGFTFSLFEAGVVVNILWPALLGVLALKAYLKTRRARAEARKFLQS